ncbi:uncharacterized protein LOC112878993 isoform X2 [Panicum hallii]|uniref:uncharacterized protein LOC112878993 isoform X2 n=1 Tax=Panicum hallii TaxID=206008 RepID=UPI000DF4DB25|nr:uncharacterized protein LOC112878993 isoform X2 [Panicum hallii]
MNGTNSYFLSHIKKNSKGVLATSVMTRPYFWNGVALCLSHWSKVLCMVDSDIKPSMAFLFGEIVKAKEQINVAFRNIETPVNLALYNNVIEIIDNKMKDRLDSPLHLAAYLLNPYYSYNDGSIFTSEQVMDGFITAVETFYHGDYDKQSKVLNEELHKFRDKQGHLGKPVAKAGCMEYDFSPANWWGSYGTQVPTLQRMAIRILSLTSSSSGCERKWSCFEDYNNRMNGKKIKAKKNQKMDPLLSTEANHAQGWLVEGGDEEDAELVCGLTWKLIEEACGVEECERIFVGVQGWPK